MIMSKFELREIGKDWDDDGVLLSTHNTKENAEKQAGVEAAKRVKKVYYMRHNVYPNGNDVIDYGLYNRFLKIKVVEDDTEL
jgi:hypothetical protein